MDWSNVCVAGGSVIAAMLAEKDAIEEGAFKSSDIDLFLWGITDQQQANEKVQTGSVTTDQSAKINLQLFAAA